jgi:hypothetical protein
MKKVLIVCGSIWIVIIAVILIGHFFNVAGLLTALLSFLALVILLTIYDIVIKAKIALIYQNAVKTLEYEKTLEETRKIARWPLTEQEKMLVDIIAAYAYIYQGKTEEGAKLLSLYPIEKAKPNYLAQLLVDLDKDIALMKGEEDSYLDLEEKYDAKLNLKPTQEEADAKVLDRFYFSLKKGFVDPDLLEKSNEIFARYHGQNKLMDLVHDYYSYFIKYLRGESLEGIDDFILASRGTYLQAQAEELKEKDLEKTK